MLAERRWRLLLVGIAAALLVLIVFDFYFFNGPSLPMDRDLVERFRTNRSIFNELVAIMKSEEAVQTEASKTNGVKVVPGGELKAARRERFQQLLAQSGALSAIHNDEEFRFSVAGWGFASKGYRIAFTYTEKAPALLIGSLDDFRKTKSEWEQAYRKMDENWYLWIIW